MDSIQYKQMVIGLFVKQNRNRECTPTNCARIDSLVENQSVIVTEKVRVHRLKQSLINPHGNNNGDKQSATNATNTAIATLRSKYPVVAR